MNASGQSGGKGLHSQLLVENMGLRVARNTEQENTRTNVKTKTLTRGGQILRRQEEGDKREKEEWT